ncbi:MAG: nucleoside hydrolase [Clostridia bacterium]|nr:nucleoside hydrolase [Clostridia bacterium]
MVKLFLDTDFGPDCDDAGALQVIHTLCNQGRAELLGVTHCTSSPCGLPAISAVNRFNGREVPLGTTRRKGFLDAENCLRYTRPIADEFDHEFKDGQPQREARAVFEEALSAQPDASVTVAAIGPMNNLADFVCDEAGIRLIRRKVSRLVCMAGRFDVSEPEWNVKSDISAARAVLERWPGEIVMCGWECGAGVMTGAALEGQAGHPVREAYRLWTRGSLRRDSWDLVTALYAVTGDSGWVASSRPGRIVVDEEGITRFTPMQDGPHRYTINLVDKEKLAGRLNALL